MYRGKKPNLQYTGKAGDRSIGNNIDVEWGGNENEKL